MQGSFSLRPARVTDTEALACSRLETAGPLLAGRLLGLGETVFQIAQVGAGGGLGLWGLGRFPPLAPCVEHGREPTGLQRVTSTVGPGLVAWPSGGEVVAGVIQDPKVATVRAAAFAERQGQLGPAVSHRLDATFRRSAGSRDHPAPAAARLRGDAPPWWCLQLARLVRRPFSRAAPPHSPPLSHMVFCLVQIAIVPYHKAAVFSADFAAITFGYTYSAGVRTWELAI